MPKYTVHLYPIVRVTVRDVEAGGQVQAIKKAEQGLDLVGLFNMLTETGFEVEYADDLDGFLVDEEGDTEHERSTPYDAAYRPA